MRSSSSRNAGPRGSSIRAGFSIVYIPLILLLLIAFVAMAVDTGRIRLAKAQLQGASDAAARAGAVSLPHVRIDSAALRAKGVADQNPVAETNVVLDQNADLEWGIWDAANQKFTVLVDDSRTANDERDAANACHAITRALTSRNNAIPLWITPHVTTFNRGGTTAAISTRSNLQTEAIAKIGAGPQNFGFIGLDYITATGNKGTITGSIGSDGPITLRNADVYGDARAGMGPPTKSLSMNSNTVVEGWQANLDYKLAPLYPPATMPGSYKPLPDPQGQEYTIDGSNNPAAPTVYYGSIIHNVKKITVTGYVKIYTNDDLTLTGASIINTQSPQNASKLEFVVLGSHQVDVGGNVETFAHIYAPQSDVHVHGTSDFTGWIVGESLTLNGVVHLNYDNSNNRPGDWKVQLVK